MTEQGTAVRPGMPVSPSGPPLGASAAPQMDSNRLQQEAQNFVRSNPQQVQQIQAGIVQALQSGELTHDELNLTIQLAKAALANPSSYPQIRQFAIQNGLGTEADIPQQYDQGLLFILLVIGQSMQAAGGTSPQAPSGNAMTSQAPSSGVLPEYKDGGMTGTKKHLAVVHPREYIIPEDVLVYHGKKNFDKMIEQARTPPDAQ